MSEERGLIVSFYPHSVYNAFKSKETGGAVYTDVDYVCINVPGDKSSEIRRKATEDDKKKFPNRWKSYLEDKEECVDGIDIKHWNFPSPAQFSTMRGHKIRTVEQMAAVADSNLIKFGNDARSLRDAAIKYISGSDSSSEIKDLKKEIENLKKQLKGNKDEPTKRVSKRSNRSGAVQ